MKIQLQNWNITSLTFTLSEEKRTENSYSLNIGSFFPEKEKESFVVNFKIEVKDIEFDLALEAVFMFHLDEKINEDFKLSDFPKINAPAIAFPYIRAFISNLTLQSGFEPVILPSINFVNLAKEDKE